MSESEVAQLIVTLIKSTAKYMVLRISNESARLVYKNAMRQCIYIVTQYPLIDKCKAEIKCSTKNMTIAYPDKWWKSNYKAREYHLLAFTQTLEIISSIEKRFVNGSCSDPNIQKEKIIAVYYNNVDFD